MALTLSGRYMAQMTEVVMEGLREPLIMFNLFDRQTDPSTGVMTMVCSGCGAHRIEYTPARTFHDIDQPEFWECIDTIRSHRLECPVLDVLAGLAGIPAK